MPYVSVITPCYNSARFVSYTIEGVRAQTFSDWEMIVVNNGSTDDPISVVAPISSQDTRVSLLSKPHGGVASARNTGFKASSPDSKYVYFLDADDVPTPEMLQVMVEYLDDHPEVGLVFTAPLLIDEIGKEIGLARADSGWYPRQVPMGRFGMRFLRDDEPQTPLSSLFALCTITPSVSVIRRSIYVQTPGWDEDFGQMYEDADLFMQIALRSEVHWLPLRVVKYRRHSTQTTTDLDRNIRQSIKLFQKWHALMPQLEPTHRQMVAEAFRFRRGVVDVVTGWETGKRELKLGHLRPALGFMLGAARRRLAMLMYFQKVT